MSLIDRSPEMYQRVLGLRVVRAFAAEPIPQSELDALLEAARWTGSSKNRQDWAFVVIEGQEDLDAVSAAGDFTAPVRAAAAAIALVRLPGGNDFDIGRLGQNIMLAAAARRVGSCPITLHHEEAAAEVLGLPADHRCRWIIALGYPDTVAEVDSRRSARSRGMGGRKPPEELISRGRLGG